MPFWPVVNHRLNCRLTPGLIGHPLPMTPGRRQQSQPVLSLTRHRLRLCLPLLAKQAIRHRRCTPCNQPQASWNAPSRLLRPHRHPNNRLTPTTLSLLMGRVHKRMSWTLSHRLCHCLNYSTLRLTPLVRLCLSSAWSTWFLRLCKYLTVIRAEAKASASGWPLFLSRFHGIGGNTIGRCSTPLSRHSGR